jgi:hypothetical protein
VRFNLEDCCSKYFSEQNEETETTMPKDININVGIIIRSDKNHVIYDRHNGDRIFTSVHASITCVNEDNPIDFNETAVRTDLIILTLVREPQVTQDSLTEEHAQGDRIKVKVKLSLCLTN